MYAFVYHCYTSSKSSYIYIVSKCNILKLTSYFIIKITIVTVTSYLYTIITIVTVHSYFYTIYNYYSYMQLINYTFTQ